GRKRTGALGGNVRKQRPGDALVICGHFGHAADEVLNLSRQLRLALVSQVGGGCAPVLHHPLTRSQELGLTWVWPAPTPEKVASHRFRLGAHEGRLPALERPIYAVSQVLLGIASQLGRGGVGGDTEFT